MTRKVLLGSLAIDLDIPDLVVNIGGFIPFGLALANRGFWGTVGLSAGVSLIAETTQLFSRSRTPSVIDFATNVLGSAIGFLVVSQWRPDWRLRAPELALSRRSAAIAAILAIGYVGFVAVVGFMPTASFATICVASFAAGFFFPTVAPTMPGGYEWLLPLMTATGGASIALSIRQDRSAP